MNSLEELSQARADVEHYAQLCREYSDRAETARVERETWEENHQILAEHYRRMTERAERAEAKLGDLRDDRDHWESVSHDWHSEVERLQRELAEVSTQLSKIELAYKTELRHAAKCQQLVDTSTFERDQAHQRAQRAEKSALAFASNCEQAEKRADWRWHALIEMRDHAEQARAEQAEAALDAHRARARADTWFELSKALMRALLALPHETPGATP